MDNKILDYIKIPNIFRDIIISFTGLTFLIFLSYSHPFKINNIQIIDNIGSFGKLLSLLAVSYISGKVLITIGDIIIYIANIIIKKEAWKNIKEKYKNFSDYVNNKRDNKIIIDLNKIDYETDYFIEKNNSFKNQRERMICHEFFLRSILGFSVLSIFFSYPIVFTFISIFLTIKILLYYKSMEDFRREMAYMATREIRKEELKNKQGRLL